MSALLKRNLMNTQNILSQVGACLIIEWFETEDPDRWNVEYYLRLPLRETDIRREDADGNKVQDSLKVPLGGTAVTGSPDSPYHGTDRYGENEVGTPYRDGAHIKWDARLLHLPAFAVYKDTITEIKVWTPG